MKKFLTILFLLIPLSLTGQVKEKYSDFGTVLFKGFSEEIPVKDQTLYLNSAGYVLVQYTSKFEKPMEMFLGATKEVAEFTLQRLIAMSDRLNGGFVVYDVCGKEYFITATKSFLGKGIIVQAKDRKGYCMIFVDQMLMMIDVL